MIVLFGILSTILACVAPIGFVCSYAFLDAILKKLEKLERECFEKQIIDHRKDFSAFIDWFVIYFGILKQKCESDASILIVIFS